MVQLFVYNLSNMSVSACLKRYWTLWDLALNLLSFAGPFLGVCTDVIMFLVNMNEKSDETILM